MLIAQEKEKTNIAEYVLYMWQIEDIIRSSNFDIEQIETSVISKFEVSDDTKYDMKMWYQNLITQMLKEGISEKGHLRLTTKYIDELNNLHNSLLTTVQDAKYQEVYMKTKENLNNFMSKAGSDATNEIHGCLSALYALFLLKLKNSSISSETKEAMSSFSNLLAELVDRYNKLKKGELTLPKEKSN